MVSYKTFYRKFRPQNFSEIIGQAHIKTALQNALKTERVAHAYLFVGQRGTGKTTTAKVLAKAMNCLNRQGVEPCNACEICVGINEGSLTDVLEIDAASNRGIDEVRDLRESVKYSPVYAKRKVYIIDEVHMMTTEAFNALLKTLEEPPRHVCFILATTEIQKIPATILSRCQRYEFHGVSIGESVAYLQTICDENSIIAEEGVLFLLAEYARGSMRDALSLLEQSAIAGANNITTEKVKMLLGFIGTAIIRELADILLKKDLAGLFLFLAEGTEKSWDERQLLKELVKYFRDLLIFATVGDNRRLLLSDSVEELAKRSTVVPTAVLSEIIKRLQKAEYELKSAVESRLMLEMALADLCIANLNIGYDAEQLQDLFAEMDILREKVDCMEKGSWREAAAAVQGNISEKKSEAVTVAAKHVPPPEVKVSVNTNTDLEGVWQKVLQELSLNNRMVHACVLGGILREIDSSGNAIIMAPTEFAKQRAETKDYKKIITEIFKKVSGLDVMPKFYLAGSKDDFSPVRMKEVKKAKTERPFSDAVHQAHEIFGGEIHKLENN